MTIATLDQLVNAIANSNTQITIDKASISTIGGWLTSLWRATGTPAQAAIPTTAAVPDNTTLGAIPFTQQTGSNTSYLAGLALTSANSAMAYEIHDRIAHMGGLVLNVITAQTITGLDLSTLAPAAARRGAADFSDLQWFLEVYANGGATASNATVSVTYGDGTTGNLNVIAVGGTQLAGRMIPLTPFIPTADQGKRIRAINSVTLSASTGTAGNFGFTCTRQRAVVEVPIANKTEIADWQRLMLPEIPNGSCLMIATQASVSTTGAFRGLGKVAHG